MKTVPKNTDHKKIQKRTREVTCVQPESYCEAAIEKHLIKKHTMNGTWCKINIGGKTRKLELLVNPAKTNYLPPIISLDIFGP